MADDVCRAAHLVESFRFLPCCPHCPRRPTIAAGGRKPEPSVPSTAAACIAYATRLAVTAAVAAAAALSGLLLSDSVTEADEEASGRHDKDTDRGPHRGNDNLPVVANRLTRAKTHNAEAFKKTPAVNEGAAAAAAAAAAAVDGIESAYLAQTARPFDETPPPYRRCSKDSSRASAGGATLMSSCT